MVKRVVILCALALGAVTVGLTPIASSAPGESGPTCADIINAGGLSYNAPDTAGRVTGSYFVAAPACKQVTYVLVVEHTVNGVAMTTDIIGVPNSANPSNIGFDQAIADDDGVVCVHGETRTNGGKVHDRAPNTGCVQISSGSGGVRDFF